jgi:hypothetical protein
MSLNELFVLNTSVRLSADMNSWGDQIINQLIKSYPSLSKLVGEVIFAKTDTVKGNAVGYITLIQKVQRIPFIVDEYELNPLDVYIDNGKYLPLSERTADVINSRIWPFRLISQAERTALLKTASLFENNGILKQAFIDKNKETLEKIASEYPEVFEPFINRTVPVNNPEFTVRCFIKEAADSKPIVVRDLITNDKEYKISEFADKYGKDFVQELMSKGETIVSNMPPKVRLAIDSMEIKGSFKPSSTREGYYWHNDTPIPARKFDHYRMSDLKRSTIAPSVIITNSGHYFEHGQLTNKWGSEVPALHFEKTPQKGEYSVAIIGDNVYGPFFINSISQIGNDKIFNVTIDDLKTITIRTSQDIKSLVQLDENNYLLAGQAKIIKIIPPHWADNNPDSFLKTANLKVTISRQTNGNLLINDSGLSGIDASKLKDLKKGDAIIVLMHCGLSQNDAKYAIMRSLDAGTYSFDAPEKTKVVDTKDASLQKKAEEIVKLCNENEILKVASISGDKSNIDLALGLNLINYSNIKRFKLIVPEIYTMLDKLCKLLIIKRMNRSLFNLDEIQLSQAIRALDEISFSLNSL